MLADALADQRLGAFLPPGEVFDGAGAGDVLVDGLHQIRISLEGDRRRVAFTEQPLDERQVGLIIGLGCPVRLHTRPEGNNFGAQASIETFGRRDLDHLNLDPPIDDERHHHRPGRSGDDALG